MIYVSLGTHEQPFVRALDIVLSLTADEYLVIQHGSTPARADTLKNCSWEQFVEWSVMRQHLADASVVVGHAGVGFILLALQTGKIPVVIPRLARFHEHVDDHQVEIAEGFAQRGLVVHCRDSAHSDESVATARSSSMAAVETGRSLRKAVFEAANRP